MAGIHMNRVTRAHPNKQVLNYQRRYETFVKSRWLRLREQNWQSSSRKCNSGNSGQLSMWCAAVTALGVGALSHEKEASNSSSLSHPLPSSTVTTIPISTTTTIPTTTTATSKPRSVATIVEANSFEYERHYYSRTLNAQLHPMVETFMSLNLERICERYSHMHPSTNKQALKQLLEYQPKHLRWAGADLFVVTNASGERSLCLIETNTCPSGQKSMPLLNESQEQGGYQTLMTKTFQILLDDCHPDLADGVLAVVFDKNDMETTGYAASLADVTKEKVYVVKDFDNDDEPAVRFDKDGVMWVRGETTYSKKEVTVKKRTKYSRVMIEILEDGKDYQRVLEWIPVRAAFRYVTQTPWSRIPVVTKTKLLNPVLCCLAGGRNKNVAAKAYDSLNSELSGVPGLAGVRIHTPETVKDVTKAQVPVWIEKFGGVGVVKNPYSNAGQGVYTITNKKELDDFMKTEATYEKFIVQSLVGNYTWSSLTSKGRLFHVGTVPDKHCDTYAADIRLMVYYSKEDGWLPVAMYSRRARIPLVKDLQQSIHSSWDMLGTNLSEKMGQNVWTTDTARLLLMDRKDFNKLGIGIDDLIDGFVQTVLAVIAIDKMAAKFIDSNGNFDLQMFESLNDDKRLVAEILDKTTNGVPSDWIKSSAEANKTKKTKTKT